MKKEGGQNAFAFCHTLFSIAKFIYSQETIWDNSVLGIMLSATTWQKWRNASESISSSLPAR